MFWAIYTIGISFVLALLAAVYIGDGNGSYALKLSSTRSNLKEFPSWILWVLTPLCVTILAYGMSVCINRICMLPSESLETVQQQAFSCAVAFVRLLSIIKRAIECVRKEPYFYGASIVWVAQAIVWPFLINLGIPFAIYISVTYNDDTEEISSMSFVVGNTCLLVVQNAFFAAGLAMKVMGILLPRHRSVAATPEPWASSVTHGALLGRRVSRLDCRLSSFLIGWGVGYWVTSLFFVLMVAWDILGWYNLPTIVQVFTWLVLPCFVFTSIFMVADINFLGAQVGAFIKPAVESLQDRRGFLFWIMATVFRDAFGIWSYPVYIILIGYW